MRRGDIVELVITEEDLQRTNTDNEFDDDYEYQTWYNRVKSFNGLRARVIDTPREGDHFIRLQPLDHRPDTGDFTMFSWSVGNQVQLAALRSADEIRHEAVQKVNDATSRIMEETMNELRRNGY